MLIDINDREYLVNDIIYQTEDCVVYQANCSDFDYPLVIKHQTRANVRYEIENHLSLPKHYNVIELLDFQWKGNHSYLVFPYYDGCLFDYAGKVSERKLKDYASDMVEAIRHLHINGIVHNDIKPENFVVNGDKVLLIDLGLASKEGVLTELRGSIHYMPKRKIINMIEGIETFTRTFDDWWSLIVTLSNVYFARHLYLGKNRNQIYNEIVNDHYHWVFNSKYKELPSYEFLNLVATSVVNTKLNYYDIINSEWWTTSTTFNNNIRVLYRDSKRVEYSNGQLEQGKYLFNKQGCYYNGECPRPIDNELLLLNIDIGVTIEHHIIIK